MMFAALLLSIALQDLEVSEDLQRTASEHMTCVVSNTVELHGAGRTIDDAIATAQDRCDAELEAYAAAQAEDMMSRGTSRATAERYAGVAREMQLQQSRRMGGAMAERIASQSSTGADDEPSARRRTVVVCNVGSPCL